MKRKVGTIIEDDLYSDVKQLAAQQRRHISEVVQLALSDYVRRNKGLAPGHAGLARLLERAPLKVTDEQFREMLELDFYDQ